ncbi:MAG: Na(+)/H(+) antiporter subunit D [Verrucomicrobiales bacterium]|nr:Na(+)/H(+) antiporter subunit D [Verrucomicrobiales bacterium]
MFEAIPPAVIYLLGALLVPFLKGRFRQAFALAIPLLGLLNYTAITEGVHWTVTLLDFELVLGNVDRWSLIFLNIFTVLSFVGILFIINDNKALDLSAGLLYAGSAMGVVMAGDLLTLFLFWEMLTLAAVLCILARKTVEAGKAAYRYLLVHVFGGVVLLAGILIHFATGGSLAFEEIELSGPGAWLIFIGFGINCGWPILGAWLTDTYPEASVGGLVFMATYTTKTAVFVLARCFPGESILIWIGVAMVLIPIFYAVIENDLRRILAYCLINQVGFMVVGIGLGTAYSLNGTAAHAYCHILYKALLFMAIGSVIYRTGKSKATELGGLYRSMPWVCVFCCLGAVSSSFPFFSGFVSKSMIMSSAVKLDTPFTTFVWAVLLFGAAGMFLQAGIRVPFATFFSRDSGVRCKEAPLNQLLAMGIVAFLCFCVGTFPGMMLYPMLPNPEASYDPYTVAHVADQFAFLFFGGLAFTLLIRSGLFPAEIRATNVDADVLYRRGGPFLYRIFDRGLNGANRIASALFIGVIAKHVCNFFESGASRMACWIMTPVWMMQGADSEQIEDNRQAFFRIARKGALPIGITASCAVVMLGLLSLIFLLEK